MKYGFEFGNLIVIRLWSHKGATCIRVLNKVTGLYVDVQTTAKGRKQYVNTGELNRHALASWISENDG